MFLLVLVFLILWILVELPFFYLNFKENNIDV